MLKWLTGFRAPATNHPAENSGNTKPVPTNQIEPIAKLTPRARSEHSGILGCTQAKKPPSGGSGNLRWGPATMVPEAGARFRFAFGGHFLF
jgi:hypothetical protein